MLLIDCPWCGPRNQNEFAYGGEAQARPPLPHSVSDETWTEYLYTRTNPAGIHHERWCHSFGCRRWFNAIRHTVTDRFWASYKIGAPPPVPPSGWNGSLDNRATPPGLTPSKHAPE